MARAGRGDFDYQAEINVLRLAEDRELNAMSVSKVVIDTGATESVAGVRSMAQLIDSAMFPYDIELEPRPRFKFGNGEYQRAISRCMVCTNALTFQCLCVARSLVKTCRKKRR